VLSVKSRMLSAPLFVGFTTVNMVKSVPVSPPPVWAPNCPAAVGNFRTSAGPLAATPDQLISFVFFEYAMVVLALATGVFLLPLLSVHPDTAARDPPTTVVESIPSNHRQHVLLKDAGVVMIVFVYTSTNKKSSPAGTLPSNTYGPPNASTCFRGTASRDHRAIALYSWNPP